MIIRNPVFDQIFWII